MHDRFEDPMDSPGRPARVQTKFVGIDLRVPVFEGEAWRGLTEEEIDTCIQQIGQVAVWAAAIIEAVVIDPTHLPFVYGLARTTASMISDEYEQTPDGPTPGGIE